MSRTGWRQKIPNEMLLLETIWKAKAEKYQHGINELLGNRRYDSFAKCYLREKIEFALFGPPPYEADQIDSKSVEVVNKLVSHITLLTENGGHSEKIFLEYTFIFLRYKNNNRIDIEVLFRLPKFTSNGRFTSNDCIFVDSTCRTYYYWEDYLKNNQLLKCDMCFPKNGIYSMNGEFSVGFAESPACKISRSILKGLDVTSSVVGIAATGVSLAALAIPIAGPLVAGAVASVIASSTYDIGRNVDKLVDLKKHKEGLGLENEKSRKIWFDVGTSALGALTVGGRAFMRGKTAVKLGRTVIQTETLAARFLKVSSIAVSGLGVVNMLIKITEKFRNGELSISDIKQFRSHYFFFFNVLLSDEIVGRLVSRIFYLIDNKGKLSFSSKNIIFSIVKPFQEFNSLGNFGMLLSMVKYSVKWVFDASLSELDSIINRMIFTAYRVSIGTLSLEECIVELTMAFRDLWSIFQKSVTEALTKVRELFTFHSEAGSQIKSNPDCARKLCLLSLDVIEYCEVDDPNDHFMKIIFHLVHESRDPYDCDAEGFVLSANYVCDKLKQFFDAEKLQYDATLVLAKRRYSDKFNRDKFNKSYGVPDNVDIHCFFLTRAIDKFREFIASRSGSSDMLDTLNRIRSQPSISDNNIITPCLETHGTKHFVFKGPPGQESLTDNQYWRLVHDLSGFDLTVDNATIRRQGSYVNIVPNDENEKNVLIFYNTRDKDCVTGLFSIINIDSSTLTIS